MEEFLEKFQLPMSFQVHGLLSTVGIGDIIDILIVTVILYKAYEMLQDTRAITLVKGLLILISLALVTSLLNLHVISWLLQKVLTFLVVALPIVFQPELRRALEHIGQGKFLAPEVHMDNKEAEKMVKDIVRTANELSIKKIGALMVFERETGLNDISGTGIPTDALVTYELMMNVFIPNTPLHDGAAIIRGNRMVAASCLLPLTEDRGLSKELGTRHRAAIGMSEQCDALILVVSEETGIISIAESGHIMRNLNLEDIKKKLMPIFITEKQGIKFKDLKISFDKWRKEQ